MTSLILFNSQQFKKLDVHVVGMFCCWWHAWWQPSTSISFIRPILHTKEAADTATTGTKIQVERLENDSWECPAPQLHRHWAISSYSRYYYIIRVLKWNCSCSYPATHTHEPAVWDCILCLVVKVLSAWEWWSAPTPKKRHAPGLKYISQTLPWCYSIGYATVYIGLGRTLCCSFWSVQ